MLLSILQTFTSIHPVVQIPSSHKSSNIKKRKKELDIGGIENITRLLTICTSGWMLTHFCKIASSIWILGLCKFCVRDDMLLLGEVDSAADLVVFLI